MWHTVLAILARRRGPLALLAVTVAAALATTVQITALAHDGFPVVAWITTALLGPVAALPLLRATGARLRQAARPDVDTLRRWGATSGQVARPWMTGLALTGAIGGLGALALGTVLVWVSCAVRNHQPPGVPLISLLAVPAGAGLGLLAGLPSRADRPVRPQRRRRAPWIWLCVALVAVAVALLSELVAQRWLLPVAGVLLGTAVVGLAWWLVPPVEALFGQAVQRSSDVLGLLVAAPSTAWWSWPALLGSFLGTAALGLRPTMANEIWVIATVVAAFHVAGLLVVAALAHPAEATAWRMAGLTEAQVRAVLRGRGLLHAGSAALVGGVAGMVLGGPPTWAALAWGLGLMIWVLALSWAAGALQGHMLRRSSHA